MNRKRAIISALGVGLYALAFIAATAVGSMTYFHFGNPQETCASCHEMGGVHSAWSNSAHRTLHCRSCHGGSLTLDAHALKAHVNRVVQHVAGDLSQPIRLGEYDVLKAQSACRECHPQSYADWQSSRHATTYSRIFLDPAHNKSQIPADDCLRCHGMFFQGSVEDLLRPSAQPAKWELKDPAKASHPAIPCLACHQIHSTSGTGKVDKAQFYDSREQRHFTASQLPVLAPTENGRPVRISSDSRQRLCTQCHAPSAALAHRLGTSDDRTPLGVHEGLSCLDCHQPHTNFAKNSCQSCHPRSSHCGIDVEKMDTTYRSAKSAHDIHTVSCRDCHADGIPNTTSSRK